MKRREIQIDAVYDIECANWTQFVCGGYLRSDGSYSLFSEHISAPSHLNGDALAQHIIASGGMTWAHFGGKYDHKWLLDYAARQGYSADIGAAGARIVTARIGRLALRDSWALVPVSLRDLTAFQGVQKQELDLPCICEQKCGGYCSIARDMPHAQYARLCDYLEADCKSLMLALERIQEYARENDLDLGATVGSSSWRTIQRWLGIPDASLDASEHTFARGGYYGGRTQLYMSGMHERVHENDVSSMYSWSMRDHAMPIGQQRTSIGSSAARCLAEQRPGVYAATIDVPGSHIPPLPYRTSARITYPTGRLQSTWTLPEIEHARELGCTVLGVSECMTWEREAFIFAPYVDALFALRLKAGKKTPQGIWLKFMLNAPTGKIGSNPDKERFFINPKELTKCPGNKPCPRQGLGDCGYCCDTHCNRKCGAYAEHSEHIWSSYMYKLDACAHIQMAAYLTSYARIELNTNQLARNEGRDVVMSDTDSIFSLEDRTRNRGSDCGQWEYKGLRKRFFGIAPKTYWFESEEGAIESRAKGLGLRKGTMIEAGKDYPTRGVIGLKSGAKLGALFTPSSALELSRKASQGVGDRVLLSDGTTRAPRIEELQ